LSQSRSKEILMRMLAVAIAAMGAISAAAPARAQTFDPHFPVCLHVYGDPTYYECQYMTMAACQQTAAGRAAQCVLNPYLASAGVPPRRPHRRVY
jgi:hypothetical protein